MNGASIGPTAAAGDRMQHIVRSFAGFAIEAAELDAVPIGPERQPWRPVRVDHDMRIDCIEVVAAGLGGYDRTTILPAVVRTLTIEGLVRRQPNRRRFFPNVETE